MAYSRVALLRLLGVAGEDNQTLLVGNKTLDIESLALRRQVAPPVVDDDTDTAGSLAADTSLLELGEGESTALTDLAVVADSLATDGGAEEGQGTDAELRSLGLAGLTAAELAAGLVEPGADTALPVLAEVVGVEDWGSRYIV